MPPVDMDDDQLELLRREAERDGLHTAAAREDLERARRLRIVIRGVLGIVVLAAFGYGMYRLGGGGKSTVAASAQAADPSCGAGQKAMPKAIGAQDAKVQIVCSFPEEKGCHGPVVDFITKIVNAHAGSFRVQFKDMNQIGKDEPSKDPGAGCAAIVVNGKKEMDVTADGKTRHISLVGPLSTHYTLKDVGDALTDAYTREYGPPATPLFTLTPEEIADAERVARTLADREKQSAVDKVDVPLAPIKELKLK